MDTDLVELLAEPLVLQRYMDAVRSDAAGAVATFLGVTRNSFDGREVLSLSYEAYEPMARECRPRRRGQVSECCKQALLELRAVAARARQRWTLCNVALAHRTGLVPVGEASVVIAVSSAHRAEALNAVHFCIDDLKASVPIWKRETYADGGASWKANLEASGT
jgi:molybdopterin synthase catalytic subunit